MRKLPQAAASGLSCSADAMGISVENQVLQTAISLLVGLGIGFIYDACRIIRTACANFCVTVVCDIIFWLIFAGALFTMGMGPSHGEMRLYLIIVCLIGSGLYFLFFGKYARIAVRYFLRMLCDFVLFITLPLVKLIKIAKKFGLFFISLFSRVGKWFTITSKNLTTLIHSKKPVDKTQSGELEDENKTCRYYN